MTDFAALQPHGPIVKVFEDVWTVRGSATMAPLVRITRTMTVLRQSGELTLVNAVRLSPDAQAELEGLGSVKNVVRIGTHGMDDAWYVKQHGAKLWALPGVEHSRGLQTDEELGDDHLPLEAMTLFRFELTKAPEAALLLHKKGGLLITCDSVQNWTHTDGCSLLAKPMTHLMGFVKPAQIGPPWRKMMTPKGGSLKSDFDRLAALEFEHLIPGHGEPLLDEAKVRLKATIQRVFG